jgi:guanosine-3',5'-bis(diphosphate) 3'-pyrophosphohydrolase
VPVLKDELGELDVSSAVRDAFELAARAHSGQTRKDGSSPYIGHPLAVARMLHEAGLDEDTVAAALLHDVVEHSEMSVDEVVERFGVSVGDLVAALTDDEMIGDYGERKQEHRRRIERAGERAAAIYAADKLVNVHDMRLLYAELGEAVAGRFKAPVDVRVDLWRGDLEMLERVIPELDIVERLRGELDAFEAERPGARRPATLA